MKDPGVVFCWVTDRVAWDVGTTAARAEVTVDAVMVSRMTYV